MDHKVKYYRNKSEVKGCEPESLWAIIAVRLILVDDDQYIFVNMDDYPGVFYEVPNPFKN